jgi:hypothetical protein
MQTTYSKPGKNQFKCFHCRAVFSSKLGDWFNWDSMQVHLCRGCDKLTAEDPQRNRKSY